MIAPIPIAGADARPTASSSSADSLTVSPARVFNIFPSAPRIEPNPMCSAATPSGNQPAARATAKTISKWVRCGLPTT